MYIYLIIVKTMYIHVRFLYTAHTSRTTCIWMVWAFRKIGIRWIKEPHTRLVLKLWRDNSYFVKQCIKWYWIYLLTTGSMPRPLRLTVQQWLRETKDRHPTHSIHTYVYMYSTNKQTQFRQTVTCIRNQGITQMSYQGITTLQWV